MEILLYKKEALKILNENRDKHIEEFAGQMQGWKIAMEQYGKDLSMWSSKASEDIFDKEKSPDRPKEPVKPVSYISSYDRFIELVIANVTDIIKIDEHEYDQIIKNKFSWSSTFLSNSMTYHSGGIIE